MVYVLLAILAVLVLGGWLYMHATLQRSNAERRNATEEAKPDDTALGDTPEAHDELNPHDLPIDHPGRQEAERQAGGEGGTTRGDQDRVEAPPARDERV
jgi:hypothetical protein